MSLALYNIQLVAEYDVIMEPLSLQVDCHWDYKCDLVIVSWYVNFRMSLIEVRGKSTRGIRKVHVLLTQDMVVALDHMYKTKMQDSAFIFGR